MNFCRTAIIGCATFLASLAAFAAEPVPTGSLSRDVTPLAYRLDLMVDPASAGFQGHVEIDVRIAHPLRNFVIHGKELDVSHAVLRQASVIYPLSYLATSVAGIDRLESKTDLPSGAATIVIDYAAKYQTAPQGLFRGRAGTDWYVWSESEPDNARLIFPGFDDPQFKTPFAVTLRTPAALRAFSNAPETGTRIAQGIAVHAFAPTKPLPTYLLGIGVGPFVEASAFVPPNSVRRVPLPLDVIAVQGKKPDMPTTLAYGGELLSQIERELEVPYPYPKIGYLTSPYFNGGVENAGLIIFGESILLKPDEPFGAQRAFSGLVAHEMAHQWFGDFVTPRWWDDLWLNESFADWTAEKITNAWRPDPFDATQRFANAIKAMNLDQLSVGHAVRRPIHSTDEIGGSIDAITYEKGLQVLRMFEQFVGQDRFAEGLHDYLEAHAYGTVTASDLFASVQKASGKKDVGASMSLFINQIGLPVVTVHEDRDVVTLSQARYLPLGAPRSAPEHWIIPVCLTRDERTVCTLLDKPSLKIAQLPGKGPLLLNAAGTGYYRFSLDETSWDRVIAEAKKLPGPAALAATDSLWADFAAGKTTFAKVVVAARAFSGNPVGLPAANLGEHIAALAHSSLSSAEEPQYERLMLSIYGPRFSADTLDVRKGEHEVSAATEQLRKALLPLVVFEGRDKKVRSKLLNAAGRFVSGDTGALDPSLMETAFGVGVEEGGEPFLKKLEALEARSSDPAVHEAIIGAFAYADDEQLARAALIFADTGNHPWLFRSNIVKALAGRLSTRNVAVDYVRSHFDTIIDSTPNFVRPSIADLFDGSCRASDVQGVDAFLGPRLAALNNASLELARVEERIKNCAALEESKGAEIAAELTKFN